MDQRNDASEHSYLKNCENIRFAKVKKLPLSKMEREDLIRIDGEFCEFLNITRVRYFYILRRIEVSMEIVDQEVIDAIQDLDDWWESTFKMVKRKTEKAKANK